MLSHVCRTPGLQVLRSTRTQVFQESRRHLTKAAQGFLEPHLKELPISATLAINMRTRELREEGSEVVGWGFGQSPFPVPELVVESLREAAHHKDYLPVAGLHELRHSIANYYGRRGDQIEVDPELVVIAPGSKELMFMMSVALKAEFLLPGPSWVSYAPQAHINHKKYSVVPTFEQDRFLVTPESLDKALAAGDASGALRVVVLNYPSNPTGVSYNADELRELADVCRRHDALVLSDEIYGELHHTGDHVSIAKFYPEGTIISSGLSKWCGAGGWRLGFFAFPKNLEWLARAFHSIGSETFSCVSSPIQQAAVSAYDNTEGGELDDYLVHSRRVLRKLASYLVTNLNSMNIDVCAPDGGFYLTPGFKNYRGFFEEVYGATTPDLMCDTLLEEAGIAMLPGSNFHLGGERLRTRLAYTNFDGAAALEASRAVPAGEDLSDAWVRQHCPEVALGVDKLESFFRNAK